jgi:hypothetical protein
MDRRAGADYTVVARIANDAAAAAWQRGMAKAAARNVRNSDSRDGTDAALVRA